MFGLTFLGLLHTMISLVALGAGFFALVAHRRISWSTDSGTVYIVATALTCLTGFGIFQHGGFGKPHALGLVTLVVLAVALGADLRGWFGRLAGYVATVGYSLTYFFHWIPGVTETTTRLPLRRPIFESAEAPELQAIAGGLFVLFLVGATLQVRQLRAARLAA